MAEKTLRRYLINGIKKDGGDATGHEDAQAGVPDVSWGWRGYNGWVECKTADKWPVRGSTPVRFKHPITAAQRNFLYERERTGGYCFLFVRIGREYLLFSAQDVDKIKGGVSAEYFKTLALRHWVGKVDWDDFITAMIHEVW